MEGKLIIGGCGTTVSGLLAVHVVRVNVNRVLPMGRSLKPYLGWHPITHHIRGWE